MKNIRAVKCLVAANVVMFVLQLLTHGALDGPLALWPLRPVDGQSLFRVWQIVTYAFLHSTDGIGYVLSPHLLFNMLGLWMFGAEIERYVGPRRLLACYFASVITAALTQLVVPVLLGTPPAPTIGASGGVFGLLLAAWVFATIYAAVELFMGVTGTLSGIAHFAHLGGMIGSAVVVMRWRWSRHQARAG